MQSFKLSHVVIGLDIGSRSVKVVQMNDAAGGLQLLKNKVIELPLTEKKEESPQEKKIQKIRAIIEALSGFDTKLVKVQTVVAGPRVSVRRITMPPMPKKELLDAIKWEAKNHVPFNIEDAIIDFQIMGDIVEQGVKKHELLVVAAEKVVVDEQMELLREAGIKVSGITAAPLAMWNLVKKGGLKLPEDKVVAVLNVGGDVTDINIFKDGVLQFTRQILIAGTSMTKSMTGILVSDFGQIELDVNQAEELKRKWGIPNENEPQMLDNNISSTQIMPLLRPIIDRLVSEIRRSFAYHREESRGQRVEHVVLVGGGSALKGFTELLSRGLGIGVEIAQPIVSVVNEEGSEGETHEGTLPRLAVAMGAAIGGKNEINLIPFEIRTQARRVLQRISAEVLFTIVCVSLIINYFFLYRQASNYSNRIETSTVELKTLRAQVEKASDLEAMRRNIVRRNSLIKELSDKGFDWVNILKEMSNLIPSGVLLSSVSFEEDAVVGDESGMYEEEAVQMQEPQISGMLKIEGKILPQVAKTGQQTTATLAKFTGSLEWSDYFRDVYLVNASKDEGQGMGFVLTCQLEQ
ncbi:MAG: type IV pilus assembly protein PilM [bacterium]